MCGIVGGVSRNKDVVSALLGGLKSLEYRGYDSAGLAVLDEGTLLRVRANGRVAALEGATRQAKVQGRCGIGHTRWATHGVPCERNAHPHLSAGRGVTLAVVHNGIIENHEVLRKELAAAGYHFTSDTDTEVVAHLLHQARCDGASLLEAVTQVRTRLTGLFALAVLDEAYPDELVVTRQGAPLVIGLAADGHYVGSDVCALLGQTREVIYLEDGDVAHLTPEKMRTYALGGGQVLRPVHHSHLENSNLDLAGHPHYMHKEIFEQPGILSNIAKHAPTPQAVRALFGPRAPHLFPRIKHVLILACGTSYHAGLVARQWLEDIAGVHCTVEVASEYRYRKSVTLEGTLVVTISQSGETADTRAALEYAKLQGVASTLTICNVPESALTRLSDITYLTHAGAEIGVASTKAFTAQLAGLYFLTLNLAWFQNRLAEDAFLEHVKAFVAMAHRLNTVCQLSTSLKEWAHLLKDAHSALFLGRNLMHPIALEGALKLKEITYIHAQAYSAGELKHGPLALVDESLPVIVSVANDGLQDKVKANLQEVLARGGELFVVASANCGIQAEPRLHVLELPEAFPAALEPVAHVIALQLLSYHTAVARGTDLDKPRNLAKSVTTE